jgi:glutathione S-transferase
MVYMFLEFKNFMGPKGKCPWITDDDGKAIADSQFIIEHLTEKHNIKMLELSPQDAAIARAMRAVLEDHLVLCSQCKIFLIVHTSKLAAMITMM